MKSQHVARPSGSWICKAISNDKNQKCCCYVIFTHRIRGHLVLIVCEYCTPTTYLTELCKGAIANYVNLMQISHSVHLYLQIQNSVTLNIKRKEGSINTFMSHVFLFFFVVHDMGGQHSSPMWFVCSRLTSLHLDVISFHVFLGLRTAVTS